MYMNEVDKICFSMRHNTINKNRVPLEQRCRFQTKRLKVNSWQTLVNKSGDTSYLVSKVLAILSPAVTRSLPDGWQYINDEAQAFKWIQERAEESCFLVVQQCTNEELVGFVFLYETDPEAKYLDIHLGYLLAETVWGKGLGNELIRGLNEWCQQAGDIRSITGGVEISNVASIRVLEKNGYRQIQSDTPSANTVFFNRTFDI